MPATNTGPQKAKTAANAIITAAAVIATLVFVNIVGWRYFGRADITEDKIFKLSKISLDTVKNLPDRINVKAIMTGDLQPPLNTTAQYVRDMLDEYKAASGGKMTVEVIDPSEIKKERQRIEADQKKATDEATKAKLDEQLSEVKQREDEIGKYKVQKISLERVSESKLEIGSDNYLGIGFAYADQIESIPSLTGTEGLEFQITSTIRKLIGTKKHKIAFANSEGELSKQQGMQMIGQFLQDYDTSEIALDKPIPDDVEGLVIAGPKQPFNEKAKYNIDQFLMKGKAVAFFVDGMIIEAPQGMQIPGMEQPKIGRGNDTNLHELFEKYGLKLRDDLVLDKQNVIGLVPANGRMLPTNYPTFVAVTEEGFPKDHALTSKVKALVTPFTSSVELVGDLKDGKVEGVKATAIARTSKASWRNSGFFLFNPTQPLSPPATESDKGPFVLGYALEGKLKSAYPNGPAGGEGTAESTPENAGVLKEAANGARLLVMGNSGLLNDEYLRLAQYVPAYGQNLLFTINTIDWLTKDDSLVALRAKGASQRPFTPVPDSSMNFWRYAIEFGLSLALIGFGLALWFLRTQRRASAAV